MLIDSISDSGVPRLFGRRARGTLDNKSYVLADNQLLSIGALGYYGGSTPGYTGIAKAAIRAHAAEDWVGPNNTGAYLSFLVTKRGTNTTVERFRITDEGTIRITPLSAAPSSPANGDIAYADGTNWNPGSGAGFYGYQGGTWVKL